jgi:hypothetical protein
MDKGLPSLAQLLMIVRSNKQAEAWLQTHLILAPLVLALSSAPRPFLSHAPSTSL